MSPPSTKIAKKAGIEWKDGTPFSNRFDDIYFSPDDGIGESEYVFLNGIGAPDIWRGYDYYTIAETGFGTGLNFLLTMQKWLETKPDGRLCFISSEAYPLSVTDLTKALSFFPSLASLAKDLIASWPPHEPGFYLRKFAEGRVELLLMIGDAAASFAKLEGKVDAWYLDGFAPSKNPDMWSDALFKEIGYLSNPNAKVATFTAAGFVKRALQTVGFTVTKTKGFGRKRERITAELTGSDPLERKVNLKTLPIWALHPKPIETQKVTIIGAGIAGASLAHSLHQKGVNVEIISSDRHQTASHVPIAMIIPRINAGDGPLREFQIAAYSYALSHPVFAKHLTANRKLDYFPFDDEEKDKNQRLFKTLNWEGKWFSSDSDILRLHQSGSLATRALLDDLLTDIPKHTAEVQAIFPVSDGWRIKTEVREWHTDAIILANGVNALSMTGFASDDFGLSAGQIEMVTANIDQDDSAQNYAFGGHLSAPHEDKDKQPVRALGSSFEKLSAITNYNEAPDPALTAALISNAEEMLARFTRHDPFPLTSEYSWRGVRTNTPDFMPYIGGVPDWDRCRDQYMLLKKDALTRGLAEPVYQNGLYILSGFGSKGYQYAPLAAEILAAQITGETIPVPHTLFKYICPLRRLARSLIRS